MIYSILIIVVLIGLSAVCFTIQAKQSQQSLPRVIETKMVRIEIERIKQLGNVVTVNLLIENKSKTDVTLEPSQILISIEPYYQDHVHEATKIKTIDYERGRMIPAESSRQVVVEFDVNHEIKTDYYFLYSPDNDFADDALYYSMTLS